MCLWYNDQLLASSHLGYTKGKNGDAMKQKGVVVRSEERFKMYNCEENKGTKKKTKNQQKTEGKGQEANLIFLLHNLSFFISISILCRECGQTYM